MEEIKVVYISGQGRSGSTILDRILGTLDGVSSLNEIYRIWEEGFSKNSSCPCGKRFSECPFWSAVIAEAFKKGINIERIWMLHNAVDHSRHFLKLYTGICSESFKKNLAEYKEVLRKLYLAVAKVSGQKVIVDSSKVPSRALILSETPGIDVHVVHIVRDVRATVYAWMKKKHDPASGSFLPQFRTLKTICSWHMRNIFSELLARKLPYHRVLYEDFARNPHLIMRRLVGRLEPTSGMQVAFSPNNTIQLGPGHSMGGNPHRFDSGPTEIRHDFEWHLKLDPKTTRMVTLASYPFLIRYGYKRHPLDPQRKSMAS
jgi:hypothetical protein